MNKQLNAALVAFALLLITGCASKLQPFSNQQRLNPEENKGIVVIAYESDTAIHSLIFSGPSKFELEHTLYSDKHNYVITSVPQGTYDMTRVKIYNKYNYISLGSDSDANWEFTVEPNKINYIGHFNIDRVGPGYKVQIKNSTSTALEFLEENYQQLMNKYPLVYAKNGPKDDFLDFVKELTKGE